MQRSTLVATLIASGLVMQALVQPVPAATVPGMTLDEVDVIHTVTMPGGTEFGWAISELEDVNGDGVTDLIVSDDTGSPSGIGVVSVFSGSSGALLDQFSEGVGGRLGYAIADAGDVDGDGVTDLVIGSYQSRDGAPNGGRFDVFSGADGSVLATVVGTVPGAQLGFDAVGLGDVDGDGVPDVAVSAALGNAVYVISGASLLQ